MNKEYKKALKIADKYIKKAENYKKRRGYKENLGYEYENKVEDEIRKLDLSYREEKDIIAYFIDKCREI